MWEVEIRTTCKECGGPLPNARFRTFCGEKCRRKSYNRKNYKAIKKWQTDKRDREAMVPSDKKCQCLICGKWYVQVGSHVHQIHKMSCREYREKFNLEVKRGVTPNWYRKKKGDQALDNGTFNNLKAGAKYRFKKGDDSLGKYNRSPITINRLKEQIRKISK